MITTEIRDEWMNKLNERDKNLKFLKKDSVKGHSFNPFNKFWNSRINTWSLRSAFISKRSDPNNVLITQLISSINRTTRVTLFKNKLKDMFNYTFYIQKKQLTWQVSFLYSGSPAQSWLSTIPFCKDSVALKNGLQSSLVYKWMSIFCSCSDGLPPFMIQINLFLVNT